MTTLQAVLTTGTPSQQQAVHNALQAYADLSDLGVSPPSLQTRLVDIVTSLREVRFRQPDRTGEVSGADAFTRLDRVIIPLWEVQRAMDVLGPLDAPANYMPPTAYDVMLTDIKVEDLPGVLSTVLRVPYLSEASPSLGWPLEGKVFGYNHRNIFSIPVSANSKSVFVHFIFDTGAPGVYVGRTVLAALGVDEATLSNYVFKVNDVRFDVIVSDSLDPCHFPGLNVLGMSYLDKIDALFKLDMNTKSCQLNKQ